ncbi:MAG: CDP-archaeol synthase [Lachnospiraceae bacterium]|nr:CDP-archaeol synthase [Lachnospiraceae bacterium]MDY5742678.1 CDP-archaeol synthase [Lachnospiraceae bacterium]
MNILSMYVTMLPTILGGITNMIFTKTGFYRRHRRPLDGGFCLKDGRRLFGDSKTVIGFCSMAVFTMLWQVLWGLICAGAGWNEINDLYRNLPNTVLVNLLNGMMFGIAYMLFELPNSLIKRRLDISAGQPGGSVKKIIFFMVDQFDSMFGVIGWLLVVAGLRTGEFFGYLLLGGLTHVAVNALLILLRIRKHL